MQQRAQLEAEAFDRHVVAIGESAGHGSGTTEWPDAKAIGTELLPVPPFDPLLLPKALRPWLADIAERSRV